MHGDCVIVKPAGRIPVDGVLTEGSSYVDESMITGEPMPVKKSAGIQWSAARSIQAAHLHSKATKVGSETMLARRGEKWWRRKAPTRPFKALMDKISSVFVPIIAVIAFLALGAWLVVGSQYLGFAQAFAFGLTSFVGVLVIACPLRTRPRDADRHHRRCGQRREGGHPHRSAAT